MKGKSGNAECPGTQNAQETQNAKESRFSPGEEQMEPYLDISREKGLRCSTIFQKQKVFGTICPIGVRRQTEKFRH